MLRRRIVLMLLATALAAVLITVPAAAGRPVDTACAGPTLSGPATARVGETYTIQGCGFAPGALVPLEVTEAGGCCIARNMLADGSGRFTYTDEVWAPGNYRVRASALQRGGRRWIVVAQWEFQASP